MKASVKVKFKPNALKNTINKAILKSNFKIKCPLCQYNFSVSGSQFGNFASCPNCKSSIKLNNDKLKQGINNLKV